MCSQDSGHWSFVGKKVRKKENSPIGGKVFEVEYVLEIVSCYAHYVNQVFLLYRLESSTHSHGHRCCQSN